ncbi:hypothetical protein AaE_005768 [Aphanomyces astaci]|uniref:DDE Tnp4 domain-containing protein n=1 Tax=Aphanomyces astaci TaxID=112090 RepID=A0A6A5A709_APHAT|nr:hypothetical protein AaE_005768 [Aphanomyces astaci]
MRLTQPSKALQRDWAVLTNAKEPLVEGVFAFVNGKNYRVQSPSNTDLQNARHNGWLHCVYVTECLCFGVHGTFIWARHNYPGSWNDGEVSRQLQERVTSVLLLRGRIITPLKEGDLDRNPPRDLLALQTMSDCITSQAGCRVGNGRD